MSGEIKKNEKWFPTKIGHPHSPELVTHFKYFLSSYDASEMKTPFLHDLKLVDSKKVLCPCSSVLIENNFIIWAVVVKWSTYVPSIWTIWVRILLTWKNIYLVLYEKTKININNGQCWLSGFVYTFQSTTLGSNSKDIIYAFLNRSFSDFDIKFWKWTKIWK